MTPSYAVDQPAKTRKGLAITSLVLGIVGLPTMGLLFVGAMASIILGAVAWWKVKKYPTVYGGKGIAIAGIIVSICAVVLGLLSVTIALPSLLENLKLGRQTATIGTLTSIHRAQARFMEKNSRFGTLEDLAQAGLIDQSLAKGQSRSGYIFTTSDVSDQTFCVHAVRISEATAYNDYSLCEDGIIRYVESRSPKTLQRREGTVLNHRR